MNYPVVKGTSYILVHAEDMVIHNGTTQSTERTINPEIGRASCRERV